jgi:hypothetical protein
MDQHVFLATALLLSVGICLVIYLLARRRPHQSGSTIAVRGTLIMSKQLNIGGTSTATVVYDDKAGAVAPIVGVPTWAVDNPAIATVTPAADGMSAEVTAVAVGTANITVTAEGDPTPGVDTITLTGTVNVVDEAAEGTLTFS